MSCWDLLLIFLIIILAGILFFLRGFQDNRILSSTQQVLLEPILTQNTKRVRIMLPTGGSGLIQDAKIYQNLIPNSYIVQVERNSPDTHPEAEIEVDVNLYLESIHGSNFFPAKEKWLMVNQEYFFPSYIELVDVLIVKSRYAEKLLTAYVEKLGLSTRVVYLGHTSFPQENARSTKKDWHLLVHFAGRSRQKGTKQLIRLWQKNKGFRHLVPDSRLVITCRDVCLNRILDELSNVPRNEDGWYDPETGLTVYPEISENKLLELRRQAGAFLCPSVVEGYGHYINEGTASSAVVMTTNFPPMNELVPDNPLLIPPAKIVESWQVMEPFGFLEPYLVGKHLPTSEACLPDFEQLGIILERYFTMSSEEKQDLASRNYQHYKYRQEEFRNLLTNFLDGK